MIAVRFRFTAGRFHATPWDRQVNEGDPEWPPAPWRIVRALVAATFRLPEADRDAARALILKLAAVLPVFWLPPWSTGHTRHYMPVPEPSRPDQTTKVFDTFVAVGGGAGSDDAVVIVGWPDVPVDHAERALLGRLCQQIAYLGRAESWVEASVCEVPPQATPDAEPTTASDSPSSTGTEVASWAVEAPEGWRAWREGYLAAGGKAKDLPADLWEALRADTGVLRAARWSRAPGSRVVTYALRRPTAGTTRRAAAHDPTANDVVVFAVQGKVLPRAIAALSIGERFRKALNSRSTDERGQSHPVFLGHATDGRPSEGHAHAFVLPLGREPFDRIEHVAVYARGGFDQRALATLRGLERLWDADATELLVTAVGQGRACDLGTTLEEADRRPGFPAFGSSRIWASRTPFVCFRHPRRRRGVWTDTPAEQVALACRHLGLPEPVVQPLDDSTRTARHWAAFYRTRWDGGGSQGGDKGFGFRLEFPEPVQGPILLGYGAHLGLGMFVAVR